ncbi:MAG: hypothetical protein N5P05_003481 [Chroococcopsis gigantea SAG 12.99]|jgi:DNA repair exonuclease SbcCD ATPase subunit|nr:hypothetical protein [Chlorogloea purpurea SAG 13.99]MDV3001875.1 hypothetical protein [Chroococcopsis gigantea SAG 12.99]
MSQMGSKESIMSAFGKLLGEYKKAETRIATKEEEAEKAKNQELLEQAAEYTVDNIVTNLATLQLSFGRSINELADTLTGQSEKLNELKRAIGVRKEQLASLERVRVVADALYILRQEHQERVRVLEETSSDQKEAIEKEMTQSRKSWEKEQLEFETLQTEEREKVLKQREAEQAEYQYQLERQRKIETDNYEETKRKQEQSFREMNQEKEKGWTERERVLQLNAKTHAENLKKIEGFEEKLKTEYNKAKGEAIKDAERDAKVKSDLFEKDWELAKQGFDLNIQSLESQIARNSEEIAQLTAQLQATTTQAQNLALRAFQGTSAN